MSFTSEFNIPLKGLRLGLTEYHFKIDNSFFSPFGYADFICADIDVSLFLDKKATLYNLHFHVFGKVKMVCDVSLEPFYFDLNAKENFIVKHSSQPANDDRLVVVAPSDQWLDVSQLIYELTVLSVPLRRIHPDVINNTMESEVLNQLREMAPGKRQKNQLITPQWEELKKVKHIN